MDVEVKSKSKSTLELEVVKLSWRVECGVWGDSNVADKLKDDLKQDLQVKNII